MKYVGKIGQFEYQDTPFPEKGSKTKHRLKKWIKMSKVFADGHKPDNFEEAWLLAEPGIGQYKEEAEKIWQFLNTHDEITSIVEVGRNLGGNTFLMSCAAKNLEHFISCDIYSWSITDQAMKYWFEHYDINATIFDDTDSLIWSPQWIQEVDFVYIDGGHSYECCTADIANWYDKCKYIGFHDYSNLGHNKHRIRCRGVVRAIDEAVEKYGWTQIEQERANSEIIFKT